MGNKTIISGNAQYSVGNIVGIEAGGSFTAGNLDVTTGGVAEALPAVTCKAVWLQCKSTNTGKIYVGDNLSQPAEFSLGDPIPVLGVNDASLIYIDAAVSGEGVNYLIVT